MNSQRIRMAQVGVLVLALLACVGGYVYRSRSIGDLGRAPQPHPPPSGGPPGAPEQAPQPGISPVAGGATILVQVVSTEGKPIGGAHLAWAFVEGTPESEGQSPRILAKGKHRLFVPSAESGLFSGPRATDAQGLALLRLKTPNAPRIRGSYLYLTAEAPGYSSHLAAYTTKVPPADVQMTAKIVLEPGTPISGSIVGLDPGDESQIIMAWYELSDRPDPWKSAPDVAPDGKFITTTAPQVPVHLKVLHLHGKYSTYDQDVLPPFPPDLQVVLTRNPDFQPLSTVTFTLTNPPPSGKLNRKLVVYSLTRHRQEGRKNTNYLTTAPSEMSLEPGEYEVVLVPFEDVPVWAHASFNVSLGASTQVPLTLEKSGTVQVKVRDARTGKTPSGRQVAVDLLYRFSTDYVPLNSWPVGPSPISTQDGIVTLTSVPPGINKIVVEDGSGAFKPWEQEFTAGSGQETSLEALLEEFQ